ncbi:hypothetical protein HMPREF9212_0444 [Lactobacillus iners LactinV 03V1-b]|nr:hypothetical protein HMPREF9212_0444 [Lactobacillus iners LactinV 03V1-b]
MSKKIKTKFKENFGRKILDQHKIPYSQLQFNVTQHGDVKQIDTTILAEDEHLVYKTLVCEGNQNSPIIAVVPVTEHLSMKKLATISNNKKM